MAEKLWYYSSWQLVALTLEAVYSMSGLWARRGQAELYGECRSISPLVLKLWGRTERCRSALPSAVVFQPQRLQAGKDKQPKRSLERWRSIKGLLSSMVHWGAPNGREARGEQVSAPMEHRLHPKPQPFLKRSENLNIAEHPMALAAQTAVLPHPLKI